MHPMTLLPFVDVLHIMQRSHMLEKKTCVLRYYFQGHPQSKSSQTQCCSRYVKSGELSLKHNMGWVVIL